MISSSAFKNDYSRPEIKLQRSKIRHSPRTKQHGAVVHRNGAKHRLRLEDGGRGAASGAVVQLTTKGESARIGTFTEDASSASAP